MWACLCVVWLCLFVMIGMCVCHVGVYGYMSILWMCVICDMWACLSVVWVCLFVMIGMCLCVCLLSVPCVGVDRVRSLPVQQNNSVTF